MEAKRMYILVSFDYNEHLGGGYKWLLLSHTGLVMARSDFYKRHSDAIRIGRRVAGKLGISVKGGK